MPIYEFRCEGCQLVFEHLALSSSQPGEMRCPTCGCEDLTRVMSACASVVNSGPSAAPSACAGANVQNRACPNAGSCSTITLPGHTR